MNRRGCHYRTHSSLYFVSLIYLPPTGTHKARTELSGSAPAPVPAPAATVAPQPADGTVRFAAGVDGGSDDAVWSLPTQLVYAKLPELLPVRPAMMMGGATWVQHVWYHGTTSPSATLAARFRSAHAVVRARMPGLQTDIEQELLSNPVVFLGMKSVDSADLSFKPKQIAWMLGARFAITPLSPDTVRSIARYAEAIRSARVGYGSVLDVRSSVAGVTAAQALAAAQMLEWSLNAPPFSAAYALCLGDDPASDDTVVTTSSGELDEAKLELAIRAVVPRPTPAQRCVSRLVCFFCGAHPLAKGVQLHLCGGCEAVAYCGKSCAVPDWSEHHRECARVRPRTNRTGMTALPALSLSVTRGDTESRKAMSARAPVTLPPSPAGMWAPAAIERLALVPTVGAGGLTFTNQWLVNHGSGGRLEGAHRSRGK